MKGLLLDEDGDIRIVPHTGKDGLTGFVVGDADSECGNRAGAESGRVERRPGAWCKPDPVHTFKG